MSLPLISIVMPVYNGSNYMRAAIDSALAQDYPNVEIVLVNDGSRDDGATDAIARSYGERVRYFSKPNGGVASALNRGLAEMRGDVFCWLSHDDIHLPHKTSRQVAEWDRLGRPDEVLISDYRLIDEAGKPLHDVVLNHALITEKPLYALLRGSIHGCTVFVPRRIFDEVGGFDESLPTTQDYDLWNKMIRRHRFRHMPEILIESRSHDEQGSRKQDHRIEARALWTRMVRGVPREEQERLEGSSYRFIGATAKFLIACGLPDIAQDLVQDAGAALEDTLVSVVILPSASTERVISSLDSAGRQDHARLEILVLNAGDAAASATLSRRMAAQDRQARLVDCAATDRLAAMEAGWRAASGQHVVFLEAGDLIQPELVSALLRVMENAGARRGVAGAWFRPFGAAVEALAPGALVPFEPQTSRISGMMFRRPAVEAAGPPGGMGALLSADLDSGTVMLDEALVILRGGHAPPQRPAQLAPLPPAASHRPRGDVPFSGDDLMELV